MSDPVSDYCQRFKVSRDYAEHIARDQKRNWHKYIQPDHPKFQQVYGEDIARNQRIYNKQAREAQDMREALKERKLFKSHK